MAFAETANLAVKLTLGGNYQSQISNAQRSFGKLNSQIVSTQGRAYKAGTQIGVGIKRAAVIVVGAVGTLTAALALAIKEGQDAANVQKVYAQSISNSYKGAGAAAADFNKKLAVFEKARKAAKPGSAAAKNLTAEIAQLKSVQSNFGPVTADYVKQLNAQQTALMNLAGIDDELIKSEQTRLIQFGLNGKAVKALTPLILDASKATGKDLLTVTVAAGKAVLGNAGALQRLGIVVDKTRFKIDPLAETIRVLNQRFGGTTQALSGQFDVRLGALRENLKNIQEDVGIKLLPALTRIVDVVGTKLVPAFGQFVDRILPDINSGLNDFADALSNGGAEQAIKGITDALGPMVDLVKVAAAPVKEIVKAFLSLPKGVQTVLIGAFAVNKLTGGLVTNVAGGLVESLGKALIGGVKAAVVNVDGAVVNVNGGIGGGGGGGDLITKGAGLFSGLGGLSAAGIGQLALVAAVPLIPLVAAYFLAGGAEGIATKDLAGRQATAAARGLNPANVPALVPARGETNMIANWFAQHNASTGGLSPDERQALNDQRTAMQRTKDAGQSLKGAAAALKSAAAAQKAAATARKATLSSLARMQTTKDQSQSINVAAPKVSTNVKVNVNVTAGGIKRSISIQERYAPAVASRSGSTTAQVLPGSH